jgi:predicted DNA binding CopG/RHH family protein
MANKVMYSFRIDEELLDKVRDKAKEKSLPTSTFIKQCLIAELNNENVIKELEQRIIALEKAVFK